MILTQTSISMSYPNENPTVHKIMHFTHSELSFHPSRIVLGSFTLVTISCGMALVHVGVAIRHHLRPRNGEIGK